MGLWPSLMGAGQASGRSHLTACEWMVGFGLIWARGGRLLQISAWTCSGLHGGPQKTCLHPNHQNP